MSNSRRKFIATSIASLAAMSLPFGQSQKALAAAVGARAPKWDILEWINGDGGNVDTLQNKVIIIDFFQLWCPGCNKFSGPLMKIWQDKFASDIAAGHLTMVKIHTVFEGHKYQTVKRLKSYVQEKNIRIPVGVDRHIGDRRLPETMLRYKTRGTPEMVIIDGDGVIQFKEFGYFDPQVAEQLVSQLINKARA